jgi:hypothetical protein
VHAAVAAAWVAVVASAMYRAVPALLRAGRAGELADAGFSGDPTLPHLVDAALHAVRALGGAAFLVVSAGVLGHGLLALLRCRPEWRAERWPIAVLLGGGGYGILGLLLAAVGAYRPPALLAAAAIPPAWLLVRHLRRRRLTRAPEPRPSVVLVPPKERGWAACAALTVGLALVAALAPDWQYDAVWFHLYFPRLFLQQGTLVHSAAEYVSLYPMTWGLWFGYGLALGGQPVATLLHFACLPMAGMVIHAAARRLAPEAPPWLAVALFAAVPMVQWEAATAYIDLAVALALTVAVYALLRHADGERGWLAVAALALGVALASKHLALVALAILGPGTALLLAARGRPALVAARSAALFAAMALVVALPWYARSWLASGNPFFPELHSVIGAAPEWWDDGNAAGLAGFMRGFGRERTLANLVTLPWDVTVHPARYGGAIGPLFLALIPLLALRPARRGVAGRAGLHWVAAFVAAYFAVWASPVASYQARWLIPIAPLLALLAAAGFARARRAIVAAMGRSGGRALAAVVLVMLAASTPPFTRALEGDRGPGEWAGWVDHALRGVPLGVVLGAESRDEYLARHVPTLRAWRYANAVLPRDAVVLAYSGGDHFFSERARLSALATSMRAAAWAPPGDSARAFAALRARGVTHVLVDRAFLRENGFAPGTAWTDYAILCEPGRRARLAALYDDGRVALYALRAAAVRQTARTGQRGQLRARAVQTRAPSSISAWL